MSPKRKRAGLKRRHWTLRQNRIYMQYLKTHQKDFQDYKSKRSAGVFVTIARILKTRKSQQVKSHHQKLMDKHGSLSLVVAFLKEEQQVFVQQSLMQQGVSQQIEEESPVSEALAAVDQDPFIEEVSKPILIQGTSYATKSEDKSNLNQIDGLFQVLNSYQWSPEIYSSNSFYQSY